MVCVSVANQHTTLDYAASFTGIPDTIGTKDSFNRTT